MKDKNPDGDRKNSTTTSPPEVEEPQNVEKQEKTEEKEDSKAGNESNQTENTKEDVHSSPLEIHSSTETALEDVDRFLASLSGKDASQPSLEIPKIVEKLLKLVEATIKKYESREFKAHWGQINDTVFLDSVERISKLNKSIPEFKSDHKNAFLINNITSIHQKAMSFLEDEFRILLEECGTTEVELSGDGGGGANQSAEDTEKETNQTENNSNFPGYSAEILSTLNRIAKQMTTAGYESECCDVYMTVRRIAFDDALSKLGFEKLSIDDIQKMQWEALEREIPIWIKVFKECTAVLFSAERKLAEEIFSDFPSIAIGLFSNLTHGVLIRFFNFTEAIAMTKHSAERLFKFLDIYEALRDNLPAIYTPKQLAEDLRNEGDITLYRIREAAVSHFQDLETSIYSDMEKSEKSTPVPGGAVHPLTRYTMNYLKYACEYKHTLEQVFTEHSKTDNHAAVTVTVTEEEEDESAFSRELAKVMDLLDTNLEAKSRLYRDVPLSCIFMMNNGRYILQKIKGSSEIHAAMGSTWYRKKSSDLPNFHKCYTRETWANLLGCLNHEGITAHGKVVKPVVKERLKNFSHMFDEIHKTQSHWVVQDEQLQSELRVSIHAVVIPAYRAFLARYVQVLKPGRQTEKYVKFQPEDVENCIEDLFNGNVASKRR